MFSRFANKTDFTKDVSRIGEGAYDGITSIDDYMKFLRGNSGLCFHSAGLYADKVENDERTTAAKAITAEDWVRPVHDTVDNLDVYDTIYDAIKRIKNSEMNLGYNNAKLGTDYDTYKNGNARITKDAYEALAPNGEIPNPDYTVTSDMRAVLKLLYGSDLANADASNNKTGSVHFNVTDEASDNFKNSPNGVSVIDALYKMLYNVPQAYNYDAGAGTSSRLSGTVDAIFENAKGFDPAVSKAHIAVGESESPVADGHRKGFILQNKDGNAYRKNRIDVLEDWVKAIYRYVGFGSTEDPYYFIGDLHLTFEDRDDGDKDVFVNGKQYCTTAYNKKYITTSGNYTLAEIALQSYYNTLKLEKVLGDDPNNYPVDWNYVIPAESEDFKIKSKVETDPDKVKATGVHAALNKLYSYINKLDVAAIDIDERLQQYARDNDKEVKDIKDEIGAIKDEIGTKPAESPIEAETLWGAIEETNVANRLVGDVDTDLKEKDGDTVLKDDGKQQPDNKVVTPAAMKAYVADIVEQLRKEYDEKCQQVKEQAIILAYLKCSNITVISDKAIQIDHNGENEDFIWEEGRTPNVGILEVVGPVSKRFGKEMCKIRIIDIEDNITYEAWFDYVEKEYSNSSSYKQNFLLGTIDVGNRLTPVITENDIQGNNLSPVIEETVETANNLSSVITDDVEKANNLTPVITESNLTVNNLTVGDDGVTNPTSGSGE
jgi:hypothetical protein